MKEIQLKEIMTKDVVAMRADEPFSCVEEKMRQHGIRHLPVVDLRNVVVGMITQRDFYKVTTLRKTMEGEHYDKEQLDKNIVERVMSPKPTTLSPTNTVGDVVQIMATLKYGAIPIVDKDKKLIGIVTQIDILKLLAKRMH